MVLSVASSLSLHRIYYPLRRKYRQGYQHSMLGNGTSKTLLQKSANVQLYKLNASNTIFYLEIALHLLVLVCLINLITDAWLWLFLLLFLLLSIQFFSHQSIRHQFSNSSLEIRDSPCIFIWTDRDGETQYSADQVKIITTRWFILLQLGKGRVQKSRLLLADSFVDKSDYTGFRRKLNEMYAC